MWRHVTYKIYNFKRKVTFDWRYLFSTSFPVLSLLFPGNKVNLFLLRQQCRQLMYTLIDLLPLFNVGLSKYPSSSHGRSLEFPGEKVGIGPLMGGEWIFSGTGKIFCWHQNLMVAKRWLLFLSSHSCYTCKLFWQVNKDAWYDKGLMYQIVSILGHAVGEGYECIKQYIS